MADNTSNLPSTTGAGNSQSRPNDEQRSTVASNGSNDPTVNSNASDAASILLGFANSNLPTTTDAATTPQGQHPPVVGGSVTTTSGVTFSTQGNSVDQANNQTSISTNTLHQAMADYVSNVLSQGNENQLLRLFNFMSQGNSTNAHMLGHPLGAQVQAAGGVNSQGGLMTQGHTGGGVNSQGRLMAQGHTAGGVIVQGGVNYSEQIKCDASIQNQAGSQNSISSNVAAGGSRVINVGQGVSEACSQSSGGAKMPDSIEGKKYHEEVILLNRTDGNSESNDWGDSERTKVKVPSDFIPHKRKTKGQVKSTNEFVDKSDAINMYEGYAPQVLGFNFDPKVDKKHLTDFLRRLREVHAHLDHLTNDCIVDYLLRIARLQGIPDPENYCNTYQQQTDYFAEAATGALSHSKLTPEQFQQSANYLVTYGAMYSIFGHFDKIARDVRRKLEEKYNIDIDSKDGKDFIDAKVHEKCKSNRKKMSRALKLVKAKYYTCGKQLPEKEWNRRDVVCRFADIDFSGVFWFKKDTLESADMEPVKITAKVRGRKKKKSKLPSEVTVKKAVLKDPSVASNKTAAKPTAEMKNPPPEASNHEVDDRKPAAMPKPKAGRKKPTMPIDNDQQVSTCECTMVLML